ARRRADPATRGDFIHRSIRCLGTLTSWHAEVSTVRCSTASGSKERHHPMASTKAESGARAGGLREKRRDEARGTGDPDYRRDSRRGEFRSWFYLVPALAVFAVFMF